MGAMPLTNKAIHFAIQKHAEQYRELSGLLYVTHPVMVMLTMYKYKDSKHIDEICAAAILHDVIEDTSLPYGTDAKHLDEKTIMSYFRKAYDEIKQEFGAMVANLVWELTSNPIELAKLGKQNYIDHKLQTISSYATGIKLADILANANDNPSPDMVRRFRHHYDFVLNPGFGKPLTAPQRAILYELDYTLKTVYHV